MEKNRALMSGALGVEFLGITFNDESLEEQFVVQLKVANIGSRTIEGFTGLLTLRDDQGDMLQRLNVEYASPVPAGTEGSLEFGVLLKS